MVDWSWNSHLSRALRIRDEIELHVLCGVSEGRLFRHRALDGVLKLIGRQSRPAQLEKV